MNSQTMIERGRGVILIACLGLIGFTDTAWSAEAVDDEYSVEQGGVLSVPAPGVLGNDCCPNRNSLTAVLTSLPNNGELDLNSDGSFTYAHDGSATTEDTFTYRAEDISDPSTATVTIEILPTNPIEGNPDEYVTTAAELLEVDAPGVLANDNHQDGAPLSAQLETEPTKGSLTAFNTDGSFTYDYEGEGQEDSFTYRATDGENTSDPVEVNIDIDSDGAGGGGGDSGGAEPGVIIVAFPAIGNVIVQEFVDDRSGSILRIRSEEGSPASVTGPDMPAETHMLTARLQSNSETGLRALARCERLALVTQARPDKYRFSVVLSLDDITSGLGATEEQILVDIDSAVVRCRLRRPTDASGGGDGGGDGEDPGEDEGRSG